MAVTVDDQWRLRVAGKTLTSTIGPTEGNPRVVGLQGSGVILARPILGRAITLSASYDF